MTERKKQKSADCRRPIQRNKQRPLVIVAGRKDGHLDQVLLHMLAEAARVEDWELLDLQFTFYRLPIGLVPAGALTVALPTDPLAIQLRRMGCPTVRMGNLPHPQDHLMPAVIWDAEAAGLMAAEYFVERGFRDVGYIGHIPWSQGKLQYEAFARQARSLGCQVHLLRFRDQDLPGAERYKLFSAKVSHWLQSVPKPIGILTGSDTQAGRYVAICAENGILVPDEVAILTRSNTIGCEMAPVPLSSLLPDHAAYVRRAITLLKDLMAGKAPPREPIRIPPKGLITRRSTDVLAVGDPAVARAVRFMWDHLDQDLSVEAVAHEVGIQRRQLERAFQHHLKRGIHAELRRKRLDRCCELLRSTDLKIADLAPQVGFRSADFLHATFKQAFGITPRRYRLQTADKR
ncbi:MAG: substrate-binding domain-containing protein [Kiritimatiellia bacterium]